MNNINIKTKILGLVTGLLVLMIVSSGYGILKLSHIREGIKEIAEEDIPLTEALTKAVINQLEQSICLKQAERNGEWLKHLLFHHEDPEDTKHGSVPEVEARLKNNIQEFEKHGALVNEELKKAEEIAEQGAKVARSEEVQHEFESMRNHMKVIEKEHIDYEYHSRQVFTRLLEGKTSEAFELAERVEKDEKELNRQIEQFLAQVEKFAETSALKAELDEQAGIKVMIIVTALSVFIAIVSAIFVARSITNPVNTVVDRLRDIAEGESDLTMRLDVRSKDEIGEIARWFNTFEDKLRKIIKDIFGGTETLTYSSTELSAISQQMSAGSEQTSGKSNMVATAAEEMNTNMSTVAAAVEQVSANTNMVASSAEEMAASVNEIAQNSEKARSITGGAVAQAKKSVERVGELGSAAQDISKVTETITEISEQTDLLALNATIEAARAGEAGKGFAVVANEIKELAKQTAEATGEIKNRIEGIRSTISDTITDIEQVSQVINEVDEVVLTITTAVEEQSVTTKEIAENVAQASSGIGEVAENVTQSSNVSGEIARDIAEINQAAGEMSNASAQVNMSAMELSKLAESLNTLVGQFKV